MGAHCGSQVSLEQAGYISWNYGNNMDCYINLVAPGATSLLYLQILENHIESGGSSCYDHLYVYEGIHTSFAGSGIHADICGSSGITEYTSSLDHTLTLRLVSDVSTTGSFSILYTAYADPFGPAAGCESGFPCDVTDRCIHTDLRCDSVDNCGDNSDEVSCLTSGDTWVCSDGTTVPSSRLCDGNRDCTDHGDERTTFPTYCNTVEMAPSCYRSVYLQPGSGGYIVYSNNGSYSGTVCATHLYTGADYTVRLGPWDLSGLPGGCVDIVHVCGGNAMYTCQQGTSIRSYCGNRLYEEYVSDPLSDVTLRLEGGSAIGGNFQIFYSVQYSGPQSLSGAAIAGIAAAGAVVVLALVGVAVYCCYSNNNRPSSSPRVTPHEHIPMQDRAAAVQTPAYPPPVYSTDNAYHLQPRLRQTYQEPPHYTSGISAHTSSPQPYTSGLSGYTSSSLSYTDLPYNLHPPPAYSADPSSQPPPYITSQGPHSQPVPHQPNTGHQGLPYPD
uniref:CUB domain-containing protein n=1 Tax=Branchiostoma floridae TaxID=7739 RepID=C3ZK25_BRAFL|eukprot:XP_002591112.1 hypothetical protein BRAFLDRAFT_109625 [Branchiostoma floridae]